MRLAAMVRLVIEKMIKRWSKWLLDILRIDNGAVADRLREVGLAQALMYRRMRSSSFRRAARSRSKLS